MTMLTAAGHIFAVGVGLLLIREGLRSAGVIECCGVDRTGWVKYLGDGYLCGDVLGEIGLTLQPRPIHTN